MDSKNLLVKYLHPFDNINNLLKGCLIVKKIYCKTKNNFLEINQILKQFDIQISDHETLNFIDKIQLYPLYYPYEFISNIDQFKKELFNITITNQTQTITIESPALKCSYCIEKVSTSNKDNWFKFSTPAWAKDAILYNKSKIEMCRMNLKQCKQCLSFHYISYSINSATNVKRYYENSMVFEYFQSTNETLIHKSVLEILLADIIFKHSSFSAFSDAYNYIYHSRLSSRYLMNPKILANLFYTYELIKYYKEHSLVNGLEIGMCTQFSNPIDLVIRQIKPTILPNFVNKWSQHVHIEPINNCSKTLTMDGNWKLGRPKCMHADQMVITPEFGPIITGCRESPAPKSYYCETHSDYDLKFKVGNLMISFNPNKICSQKPTPNETIITIHNSHITNYEIELFLCEMSSSKLKWIQREYISEDLYTAYLYKLNRPVFNLQCNTDKTQVTTCEIKCKTRGILLSATNCGIVISFRELFGSESLSQVSLLYLDTLDNYMGKQPNFIIYDDACHLIRFVDARFANTPTDRLKNFSDKKFAVDKLHIQGHKENCLKNCHPKLFPELNDVNTVICEQINYWLGSYKYMMKHMIVNRYNFFLYIILNEYNKLKINGKFNVLNPVPISKTLSTKRQFESDNEDDL